MNNYPQFSSGNPKTRRPCCSCNGVNARCKPCACARANRACINCRPTKHGGCLNTSEPASQSPSTTTLPTPLTPESRQLSFLQPPLQLQQLDSRQSSQFSNLGELPHQSPVEPRQVLVRVPSQPCPVSTSESQQLVSSIPPSQLLNSIESHLQHSPVEQLQPMSQPPSHPGVITSLPPPQPQPSSFPPHSCQQSSTDPTKSSLSSQSTSSPLSSQSYQAHSQSPCSSRQALLSRSDISTPSVKKKCCVSGCTELIAPTMWRTHMSQHAKGVFPGTVPDSWLNEQDASICNHCRQLVSKSRMTSHTRKCTASVSTTVYSIPSSCQADPPVPNLPSFEEVCELNCPTLRFIPARFRPDFARILSSTLNSVILTNSVESWLKLFMLPKCVLPLCKRRGRHNRPISIKFLCDLWAEDDFVTLWNLAKARSRSLANYSVSRDEASSHHTIDSAVSLARDGLIRKASRVLLSDGIAPNNDQTWKLLQSKHPSCPLPLAPKVISEPLSLGRNFDILSVLKSFPKDTAVLGPLVFWFSIFLMLLPFPLQPQSAPL